MIFQGILTSFAKKFYIFEGGGGGGGGPNSLSSPLDTRMRTSFDFERLKMNQPCPIICIHFQIIA